MAICALSPTMLDVFAHICCLGEQQRLIRHYKKTTIVTKSANEHDGHTMVQFDTILPVSVFK